MNPNARNTDNLWIGLLFIILNWIRKKLNILYYLWSYLQAVDLVIVANVSASYL